jgi:hypothetical protein
MTSTRKFALAAIVFLHFVFVLAGAAKRKLPSLGRLNQPTALYLAFSGAHYSWGFFAPNIGSQFKTEFRVHLADGRVLEHSLGSRGPDEVLLRQTGLAATFWFGMQDTRIRRSLTASWAASEFTLNPDAKSVEVNVSAFYLPSMRQLRAGANQRWVPVYSAEYGREGSGT